ncbi:hypothetical protein [Lacinutrix sp. Hel_I_90]|uniref:hypothetical protein n=1 Tax=Lacinutrix sp. Hel_I_90 TaxID=1249999 RepID=UPI0005CAC6C7|nr:hypothetical protein [Lacinutrix sp. Hel_I_90]
MNKQTSQIITAVLNNEVIYADTNLKSFRDNFAAIEPSFWHYYKLYPKMKKTNKVVFEVEDKQYHIQITKAK